MQALEQLAADKDADVREAAAARCRVQTNPPIRVKVEEEVGEVEQTAGEDGGDPEAPSWAQIASK